MIVLIYDFGDGKKINYITPYTQVFEENMDLNNLSILLSFYEGDEAHENAQRHRQLSVTV
jgi:hypothetical protein